jgi:S1-C subfamily serine protease
VLRTLTLCLWLASLVLLFSGGAAAIELPELAAQTKPSVVHLSVRDASGREISSGTGFFVDGPRVATNEHVVSGAAQIVAKLPDGRELDVVGVLVAKRTADIAIIEVSGDDLPPALKLGSTNDVRQGDEVVVIGSPRGLAGTLSTGIVSALRDKGLDGGTADRSANSWGIQITAAISPGSSGSPVLTRDGTVIAVAVGIVGSGGNLGFSVPIERVKEMLEEMGPDAVATPFAEVAESNLVRNLIISVIFFGAVAFVIVIPGVLKKRRRKRA